jgi:hypothetical protein
MSVLAHTTYKRCLHSSYFVCRASSARAADAVLLAVVYTTHMHASSSCLDKIIRFHVRKSHTVHTSIACKCTVQHSRHTSRAVAPARAVEPALLAVVRPSCLSQCSAPQSIAHSAVPTCTEPARTSVTRPVSAAESAPLAVGFVIK